MALWLCFGVHGRQSRRGKRSTALLARESGFKHRDQGHLRTTKVYRDAPGKSGASYPPLLEAIVQAWLSRRSASGSTVMPKKAKQAKTMKEKKAMKVMKVKKAVKAMKAMKAKKGAQTHAKKAKTQEKEQKEQKEQTASWMTPLLQNASKRCLKCIKLPFMAEPSL